MASAGGGALVTNEHAGSQPSVEYLRSVSGVIVRDLPNAPASGGGTRLTADLTVPEVRLLARAMTYKLAVLGIPVGGAKIGLRAAGSERDAVIARFRHEIAGRLADGSLMTGPDLGTTELDFAGLPSPGGDKGVASMTIDGRPAEEVLTGIGVASALAAVLSHGLDGRSVAIEGFGKMGTSIAHAVSARGGRIAAVSTVAGCVIAAPGAELPVSELIEARAEHGDELVHCLGRPVLRPRALWTAACDAIVPGARPGVLNERTARLVRAGHVVPVANAPYTAGGLLMLVSRGIVPHADFVASAGGAMAYLSPDVAGARHADAARAAVDAIMGGIVGEASESPDGPYWGAVSLAERFLRTWVPRQELPDGPAL